MLKIKRLLAMLGMRMYQFSGENCSIAFHYESKRPEN